MNELKDDVLATNNERFIKFLQYRGISRVPKPTDQREENQLNSRELRRSYNLFSSSEDELADIANRNSQNHNLGIYDVQNLDIDINDERVIDYFGLSRVEENPDADQFYTERRDSFPPDEFSDIDLGIDSDDEMNLDVGDKDIQYIVFNKFGDRRYGNSSKEGFKYESANSEASDKFPVNSQKAYVYWEAHDSITRKEITPSSEYKNNIEYNDNDNERNNDNENNESDDIKKFDHNTKYECSESETERVNEERYTTNGGVYDPDQPQFTELEDTDITKLVSFPPARKYRDLVLLDPIGEKKVANIDNVRKYKNNISIIISDNEGNDYLATCANSEVVLYGFDPTSQLPNHFPIFRFDTKPTFTTTTDRLISTWPYFPHTINFIKADKWLGKPILGACLDDGSLMIWNIETITEQISKFAAKKRNDNQEINAYSDQNRSFGIKIKPDFKLKMEASLWGLDFLSYQDVQGNSHNLIVASDNSQSVVLFYYHQQDERFYHIKSHQILHNIPEVSFLSFEVQEDVHKVKVACASISGELIVFKFSFRLNEGPLDKDEYEHFKNVSVYYVDPSMAHIENRGENRHPDEDLRETELRMKRLHRVVFTNPTVITRVLLDEDCWTCKPIPYRAFKQVQSIRAMTGDHKIDEKQEIEHIMNESEILDFQYDPVQTSHLGLGAHWQFFESPVLNLTDNTSEDNDSILETAKLTGVDDDYRRIHKGIECFVRSHKINGTQVKSMNGKDYWPLNEDLSANMLAVSTSKKLSLFRADTLFCNSATKKLFDLSIPFNEESKFSNRISITHIIPELLCFVAVTQQGLISIMRLCTHRGLYGMRQEHIFPNALALALGSNGYRTITGLAVRNMSVLQYHRYFIYVTYTDGIVVAYQLTMNNLQELVLVQV